MIDTKTSVAPVDGTNQTTLAGSKTFGSQQSGGIDLDLVVVDASKQREASADRFADFLNASETTTLLKAQDQFKGPVFDPVQDIERQSALQGYGTLGQSQPV